MRMFLIIVSLSQLYGLDASDAIPTVLFKSTIVIITIIIIYDLLIDCLTEGQLVQLIIIIVMISIN